MQLHRPWRKILYEKQNYPDNFIDINTFFDSLQTEVISPSSSYKQIVLHSTVVAQPIIITSIFLTIYKYIVRYNGSHLLLFRITFVEIILLMVGYVITTILDEYFLKPQSIEGISGEGRDGRVITMSDILNNMSSCYHLFLRSITSKNCKNAFVEAAMSMILVIVYLRVAAPVLQTLTSFFVEDTVHGIAIVFSTMHLVFYDYFNSDLVDTESSGTLSLNAAMFTAVLLASRLKNMEAVVILILFAIIGFSLFPKLSLKIKRYSVFMHLMMTNMLMAVVCLLLWHLDLTLLAIFIVVISFVWFLCPILLLYANNYYKKRIYGPWGHD